MGVLRKRWATLVAISLIALHGAMLLASARKNSVAYDEFAHLPAGLAYLKYREFSVYNLSPPLLRMWGAWPAWMAGPEIPHPQRYRDLSARIRGWLYAWDFGRANVARYPQLVFLGRLPMIALSMAGPWLVFSWSRKWYGDAGGVLSCAMYALDPNFAAHGSILGTDVGFAIAVLLALRCWIGFSQSPTPRRALVASAMIALAHCCKTTGLLLWPILPVVFVIVRRGQAKRWADGLAGIGLSLLLTWLAINASYGFWKPFERLGDFQFESQLMNRLQRILPDRTPILLARDFVRGFDAQKFEADGAYSTWMLGKVGDVPSPIYYSVTMAVKTPLATMGLIIVALLWRGKHNPLRREEVALLAAIVLMFLGLTLLMHINLGLRYLLPIYPLMFVLCGRLPREVSARRAVVASILIVGLVIESASACPRYFEFFNLIGGGTGNGYKTVSESNFDWGQSLIDLRDWQKRNGGARIDLAYQGRADPAWYGVNYSPLIEPTGEKYVAISQMFLTETPLHMATPNGTSQFVTLAGARKLLDTKPLAKAGSIFIFDRSVYDAAHVELKQ